MLQEKIDSLSFQKILSKDLNVLKVFNSIHDGIIVIDSSSRILFANQGYTRILGVPVNKILGKKLKDIEPSAQILRVLETGKPILRGYVSLTSVDRDIICDQTPVLDKSGNLLGAVATFYDPTENFKKTNKSSHDLNINQLPIAFRTLLGKSKKFLDALFIASRAARVASTVLIYGESGVGKELLAKAIHDESKRNKGPFVPINCAAIPENLLESELFGYEEGAFTGAKKNGHIGKIERANKGTLFLDEIGELPLPMQAKILRVLQERQVERIGANRFTSVDVRFIAATNRNLEKMVKDGLFREDLYYRLSVIPIKLPPLRERKDDISLLVHHFLKQFDEKHPKPTKDYLQSLMSYHWPGNVRELQNAIEFSLVMSQGETLESSHLPSKINGYVDESPPIHTGWAEITKGNLKSLVRRVEKRAILDALRQSKGNRSKAIDILGVSRATFYKKLEEYKIEEFLN